MLLRIPRRWELPEGAATPESAYLDRRRLLRRLGIAAGGLLTGAGTLDRAVATASDHTGAGRRGSAQEPPEWLEIPEWPAADLYPAPVNVDYRDSDRPLTDEGVAASYNNFYELTPRKERVRMLTGGFETRPWTVEVDGLVERPRTFDVDALLRQVQVEERIYRLRCVEAWSAVVPWTGFPLRELLRLVGPLDSARYVRFETAMRPEQMPGIGRQPQYPWPYVEGIHIEEARNELAFLASGIYGHPLPRQHGAPLRLVLPWKYGFKSIKSIARIELQDSPPATFWNRAAPEEYGFWANVHPDYPHPRWSQATERPIPDGDPIPTRIFNGYGDEVAHLYRGMEGRQAFY